MGWEEQQLAGFACVEVGGSGTQTVLFDAAGAHRLVDSAVQPAGALLGLAVPGLIEGDRVLAASNLDWYDIDPVAQLGLVGPAAVLCNDAEAAALGEAVLRDSSAPVDLVHLAVGTGIGGAVVVAGHVVAGNLFGHARGFSEIACRCGAIGCLETVASGWALPASPSATELARVAEVLALAIDSEPAADGIATVVLAGGVVAGHPSLLDALNEQLPGRSVEASAAPEGAKSAAPWGLLHLLRSRVEAHG
jgi:predicted NBD/HSP70 family sugar kinase